MSTLTATRVEAPAHPVSPARGLIRAVFRLHQAALWFWALLVVLIAGALLWAAGPGLDAAWAEYLRSDCARIDYCETGPAYNRYGTAVSLGTAVLIIAPLLVGAWAGGALIARELELGTARLAWTQSVTPTRWLAAKLAVPGAVIVSGTVLLTLLHRLVWARETELRSALATRDWFTATTFAANGTLATAYALLGLAVGVLAGLLLRRSLPALGLGALGTGVVMAALRLNRHRMWPVETSTSKTPKDLSLTGDLVGNGLITASGERYGNLACEEVDCGRKDVVGYYTEFHPSSHFWPMQLVETGIVLALAAALVLGSFWLLRRRTGGAG
ncbi:hypothetical protein SGFS_056980 [Streptomyces graminofaciens]|uniref:ABC transporter n=1 Tax=Streptomyces graminofaciens TaxID=68212 RepID=A0ABM8HLH7_9ACTN|nr:ABC transporter permease [Streptomyces graminofaciens]BBC34404.1 hypothetical protein SGFS_056980 [Streptomyces graminofaciens]